MENGTIVIISELLSEVFLVVNFILQLVSREQMAPIPKVDSKLAYLLFP